MKIPIRQAAPLATQRRNGNNSNWPTGARSPKFVPNINPQQ